MAITRPISKPARCAAFAGAITAISIAVLLFERISHTFRYAHVDVRRLGPIPIHVHVDGAMAYAFAAGQVGMAIAAAFFGVAMIVTFYTAKERTPFSKWLNRIAIAGLILSATTCATAVLLSLSTPKPI